MATITTWETPQAFFDMLNKEFNFSLDVCALPETAKCKRFFSPEQDGLSQDWSKDTCWMNPPYGRGQDVYSWVKKAYETVTYYGGTVVCLLPASVDTKWFHEFCLKAWEIRIVRDRLWFSLDGGKPQRANHGSFVVIFRPGQTGAPKLTTIPNCRKL